MTTVPLPPSIQYGKIVGQIIQTSLDAEDVDEQPDGRGVAGTVTLMPLDNQGHVVEGVFVFFRAFVVTLSTAGKLQARPGQDGVWLPVGNWRASFALLGGVALPDKDFEVTTAHTTLAPLNIMASLAPIGPSLSMSQYSALDTRLLSLEAEPTTVALTQAAYDALPIPDPDTVYVITAP